MARTSVRRPPTPATGRPTDSRRRTLVLGGCLLALCGVMVYVWSEPILLWQNRSADSAALTRLVAARPESPERASLLCEALLREGKGTQALEVITPWVERRAADPRIRTQIGRALLAVGRPAEAFAHLQLAVRALNSEDPATRYWLGRALELADRGAEAAQEYQATLQRHPRYAPALLRLAGIARAETRVGEAERLFRQATVIEPSNAEAWAGLAEALFRLGRGEAAATSARRALQIAPHSASASLWLARALQTDRSWTTPDEVVNAYRAAIRDGADAVTPRYYLAQFLREQGRREEAMRELRANIAANSLHRVSYYELALCARSLGLREEAAAALKRYRRLNQLDLASSEMEYRVWVSPEDMALRLELARFYFDNGRPDLAKPQVEYILQRRKDDPGALALQKRIGANPQPTL